MAILLLVIVVSTEVKSQATIIKNRKPDCIVLYFRFDEAVIDSSYMSNNCSLKKLNELLSDHESDSISIISSSSPEGISEHNIVLSKQRAKSIFNYIGANNPHIHKNKDDTTTFCVHDNWSKLYSVVKDDEKLPYKTKVLSTLLTHISSTCKERRLKQIGKGTSWEYLKKNYFPLLRSGTVRIMAYSEREAFNIAPLSANAIKVQAYENRTTGIADSLFIPTSYKKNTKKTLIAIKTNLLFDAATALNVELELPVTDRWSIAGEWIFPWWLWSRKQYCLQVLSGNIEGKYWLGKRESRPRMIGWFAGLYAGGGLYDIEWGTRGYQGEFFIAAGLSSGYAHTINKSGSLRMEYSLGIGYLRTNYREYEPMENGNVLAWKRNGQYTWIGPTRAKVSLVWLINGKIKKGGK